VTAVDGTWTNVVGLPLGLTQGLLELAGVAVGAVVGR
jgi:predicted house-cleaning NTP pyrophosphatase (Maf/HAM1 superfamily)